jgi:hypothetical protein
MGKKLLTLLLMQTALCRGVFSIAFLGLLLGTNMRLGQSCGVWNVTTPAELTTAVTDACTAGGGIVKITAGTYTIDNPITICGDVTL